MNSHRQNPQKVEPCNTLIKMKPITPEKKLKFTSPKKLNQLLKKLLDYKQKNTIYKHSKVSICKFIDDFISFTHGSRAHFSNLICAAVFFAAFCHVLLHLVCTAGIAIRGHMGQNSTETRCRGFLVLESRCHGFSVLESPCRGFSSSEKMPWNHDVVA